MSNIQDYLSAITQLKLGPKQQAFFQWQLDNSNEIKIVSYKELLPWIPDIESILRRIVLEPKHCYPNAARFVQAMPYIPALQFEYVEGYATVCGGMPIEHAFNKCTVFGTDGLPKQVFYIDITLEYVLSNTIEKLQTEEYVELFSLPRQQINQYMLEEMCFGPWKSKYYKSSSQES